MNILRRLHQYKIYRRIIISYILLITLTISLVCSILFGMFSSSTVKEIDTNSRSMLTQTSYTSDLIYSQVMNIAKQLTIDNNIVSFLYSDNADKIAAYNASMQLSRILDVYPFVKYIELCNTSNGNYYNTLAVPLDLMEKSRVDTFNLLKLDNKKYFTFVPRIQFYGNSVYQQTIRTLSFIFFPYPASNNHAIIINIDEKYIQNIINSLSSSSLPSNTFVMDSSGTVLSHTDPSNFLKNFSGKDYIKKILASSDKQGGIIQEINGTKQLITYVKSNAMDWCFVSLKTYDQLLGNIYALRTVTLLTGFLLLFFGILLSWFLTRSIYNPMKLLIDKIKPAVNDTTAGRLRFDEYQMIWDAFSTSRKECDIMQSSIQQSSPFIKEKYILNLLKGNLSTITAPEDILSEIQKEFTGPFYRVFVIKVDDYVNFQNKFSEDDRALMRFCICNIAHELLGKHFHNDMLITEQNEIAVLAQFTENVLHEDIILCLMEIQENVKKYCNFTISIGMGDAVFSDKYVYSSYKSARENIKYRYFYGSESILYDSIVREHNSQICKYPNTCEKKLLKALQSGNQSQVNKSCEEFIKHILKASYYQTVNYSTQLMLAIFKNFQASLDLLDENYKDFYDRMNQLGSLETIEDTLAEIKRFCLNILQMQEEKNSNINTQKHVRQIEEIKAYVAQHYSDPGLSLDIIADVVELSSGYIGKLFKSITNTSFSDYLTTVRLERAKELLNSTGEPASKICEKIGIYNVTYFSTLFKKTYGITPSQYREQSHLQN